MIEPRLFDEPSTVDAFAPVRAGTYRTVLADPPWLERGGGRVKRGADRHYPLMKTAEIAALPVDTWAASDAHLFLPDGLTVMAAWGFRYVTAITWCKRDAATRRWQVGLGQYYRGVSEHCLFGVRGTLPYRALPTGKRAQGLTAFDAPRGRHSAKPETLRQTIERVSHGPYLEMFARVRAAGDWDAWGNEVAP